MSHLSKLWRPALGLVAGVLATVGFRSNSPLVAILGVAGIFTVISLALHAQFRENLRLHADLRVADVHQDKLLAEIDRLKTIINNVDAPSGCTLLAWMAAGGWVLMVHKKTWTGGYDICHLAWPNSWPESVDADFLRAAGFEVIE